MGDHHGVVVHVGGGEGRAHARALGVRAGLVVDPRVGGLDQLDERLGRLAAVGQAALELLHRELGRHLAGLRAAHPVGDDEQRGADEEVVLVALALAAQVGVVEVLGDAQHGSWSATARK